MAWRNYSVEVKLCIELSPGFRPCFHIRSKLSSFVTVSIFCLKHFYCFWLSCLFFRVSFCSSSQGLVITSGTLLTRSCTNSTLNLSWLTVRTSLVARDVKSIERTSWVLNEIKLAESVHDDLPRDGKTLVAGLSSRTTNWSRKLNMGNKCESKRLLLLFFNSLEA